MTAARRAGREAPGADATAARATTNAARFVDPASLAGFGSMSLRARAVVEGVVNGLHRSPHRGASVEFAEYKEYAPGDDIRHIDWRAVARKDRYYVKQYEDETNLRAFLLLDASGSMGFAFETAPSKLLYASTLLASLAHLLLRQGDAPALVTCEAPHARWLPPSNARSQLEDICTTLDALLPAGRATLGDTLNQVVERARARSLVVVASDFLDGLDDALDTARVMRRRGFEVVFFQVLDRAEVTLPFEGLTLFEGLEDDGDLLADPDALRQDYLDRINAHLRAFDDGCTEGDIERFRAFTDEPVEQPLLDFFASRQRRR